MNKNSLNFNQNLKKKIDNLKNIILKDCQSIIFLLYKRLKTKLDSLQIRCLIKIYAIYCQGQDCQKVMSLSHIYSLLITFFITIDYLISFLF